MPSRITTTTLIASDHPGARIGALDASRPNRNGQTIIVTHGRNLVLRTEDRTAVIEVKSFGEMWELAWMREQAARYAKKLSLAESTLVVFAPTNDDVVLAKLASEVDVDGVHVTTVPFGWV